MGQVCLSLLHDQTSKINFDLASANFFFLRRVEVKQEDKLKGIYYLQEAIEMQEMQKEVMAPPLQVRRIMEIEVYYKNLQTIAKLHNSIGRKEASLKYLFKLYKKVNFEKHNVPNTNSSSKIEKVLNKEYNCVRLRNLSDIASCLINEYGDEEEGQKFLKLAIVHIDVTKKEESQELISAEKDMYFAMDSDMTNNLFAKSKASMKLKNRENPMVRRIEKALENSLDLSTSLERFDNRQDFVYHSVKPIQRAIQQIGDLENVHMKVKTDLYFKACYAIYGIYVTNYPMHLEAIDVMKSVLPLLPPYQKRAEILLAIAKVYRQCNYFKKSLKLVKKAQDLKDDFQFVSGSQFKDKWIHLNRAFCHFGLKEYELAQSSFCQASSVGIEELQKTDLWKTTFAKDEHYSVFMIKCFIKLKQYEKAIIGLETASSPLPRELENKILLLISYQQMGRKSDLIKQRQKVGEALLQCQKEALWSLYDCLDGFAEYYDDLAFNIKLVQKPELLLPKEAPNVFMLSKNSFYIKECFKNKITLAKNLK